MCPGVHVNILFFIRLGAELRVPVPAGVQQQNVALAHFDARLDHLRRVGCEFVHFVRQVHDNAGAVQPLHWNLIDGHAAGDEMARGIQVRAYVI